MANNDELLKLACRRLFDQESTTATHHGLVLPSGGNTEPELVLTTAAFAKANLDILQNADPVLYENIWPFIEAARAIADGQESSGPVYERQIKRLADLAPEMINMARAVLRPVVIAADKEPDAQLSLHVFELSTVDQLLACLSIGNLAQQVLAERQVPRQRR